MRPFVGFGLVAWVGTTLLLSCTRWSARRPLAERIAPYLPGPPPRATASSLLSVSSFRDVVAPLATGVFTGIARVGGRTDDLGTRLVRVHSPLDTTAFRVRQLGSAVAALGAALVASLLLSLGPSAAFVLVLAAPTAAAMTLEHSATRASRRWQQTLTLELPVVAEQVGMLLAAGYSLGSALNRIATRSNGACSQDLARVGNRVRQGLSEAAALREWADVADVAAVHRLVSVLALDRDAGDIGRLISDEARAIRRDVQRHLLERIERREQHVWIPVTVATLVPGVIFLSVPFLEAMRLFTGP